MISSVNLFDSTDKGIYYKLRGLMSMTCVEKLVKADSNLFGII